MEVRKLDRFIQTYAADTSRRRLVAGLGGSTLTALFLALMGSGDAGEVAAKGKKRPNRKKKRKKKTAVAPPPDSPPPDSSPPPPPSPQLIYECAGPPNGASSGAVNIRFAQLFTASSNGALRRVEVLVSKDPGSTGDYQLQLVKVKAGVPSHDPLDILAGVTIPDATVPSGNSRLSGEFIGPKLVQGTDYAVVVSRPGSTDPAVFVRGEPGGGACSGQKFSPLVRVASLKTPITTSSSRSSWASRVWHADLVVPAAGGRFGGDRRLPACRQRRRRSS